MKNICTLILNVQNAPLDCAVAGKSLFDWAVAAAYGYGGDVYAVGFNEEATQCADNKLCFISYDEAKEAIKQYERIVVINVNQLVYEEDAARLAKSNAPCAVLTRGEERLSAWSIDSAAFNAEDIINGTLEPTDTIAASEYAAAPTHDMRSLSEAIAMVQKRIRDKHFENGVLIMQGETVYIDADVKIAAGAVIWPNNMLCGKTSIGANTQIKPGCNISNSTIGEKCVLNYVYANEAAVGDNVTIGPYVNLRPNTVIANGCKIGDFVEVKNSNIGEGTKLPHLSYIGDADVGARVNVGCGCVFVNYDGVHKHRTVVGDDVFLGCQTNLVAPVSVGDGAYTAAGSTITKNVPSDAMAFARTRQENKEGYASRYKALKKSEK